MANIVVNGRGTLHTTQPWAELCAEIDRGDRWITLHPTGTLVNLDHVVTISNDND